DVGSLRPHAARPAPPRAGERGLVRRARGEAARRLAASRAPAPAASPPTAARLVGARRRVRPARRRDRGGSRLARSTPRRAHARRLSAHPRRRARGVAAEEPPPAVSARVVLCYGDSNTLGWDATTGSRFPQEVRWPGLLAAKLGDGWRVVEDGVGGRTTIYDDPVLAGVNGLRGLEPALRANAPLDLVVLFLGTNDFKPQLGLAAGAVADGVRALVEHVLASDTGPGGAAPAVLVLGLPRLGRHHGFSAAEWAR